MEFSHCKKIEFFCNDNWVSGVQIFLFCSKLRTIKLSHIISKYSVYYENGRTDEQVVPHLGSQQFYLLMKNNAKAHLKTHILTLVTKDIGVRWIVSPCLKKFKQVTREPSLVELITSINNELLVVSKHQLFYLAVSWSLLVM